MDKKLSFSSDYMEGCHQAILEKLVKTNFEKTSGYGTDEYTEAAKEYIREACGAPDADVFLLVGGTQTNATVIDALLRSYQGVIAADTGHISTHEAGAIEANGHKVLAVKHENGKISAAQVEAVMEGYENDDNHEHMVMPGMVYISQPTEYGTLYSLKELTELSSVCRRYGIPLYVDGARLAYALACPANDVSLVDMADLCDVFYIGGTKCGALFGEAVVIPKKGMIPHFFTIIKQHGALFAKGRLLGIQFGALFEDGLYERIGQSAAKNADRIREALGANGFELCFGSPTNQVFCVLEDSFMEELAEKVEFGFWEKLDESHTVVRFATSWATRDEDVDALVRLLEEMK